MVTLVPILKVFNTNDNTITHIQLGRTDSIA